MPTITWQVHLEDGPHLIVLEHDRLRDQLDLHVDGKQLGYLRPEQVGSSTEYSFYFGRYHYIIAIATPSNSRSRPSYKLRVDGSTFDPISEDYKQDGSRVIQGCLVVLVGIFTGLGKGWQRATARYRMPGWIWWFIFACCEIHLIGWGGLTTGLLTATGVMGCTIIGIIPSFSTFEKVCGCTLITFIMWALYFAVRSIIR